MDHIESIKAVVAKAEEQGQKAHDIIAQQIGAVLQNIAGDRASVLAFAQKLMRTTFGSGPAQNIAGGQTDDDGTGTGQGSAVAQQAAPQAAQGLVQANQGR